MKCRICGCTDERACPGGCFWVGKDLCSRCVVMAELSPPLRSLNARRPRCSEGVGVRKGQGRINRRGVIPLDK